VSDHFNPDGTHDYLAEAVEWYFGERCVDHEGVIDFDGTCHCCLAWKQYDEWKTAVETPHYWNCEDE
jgi:hypothetical protein